MCSESGAIPNHVRYITGVWHSALLLVAMLRIWLRKPACAASSYAVALHARKVHQTVNPRATATVGGMIWTDITAIKLQQHGLLRQRKYVEVIVGSWVAALRQ